MRGRVVEMTVDGADEHIDELAGRYMGVDSGPRRRTGEQRVMVNIAVDQQIRRSFRFRDSPIVRKEPYLPGCKLC